MQAPKMLGSAQTMVFFRFTFKKRNKFAFPAKILMKNNWTIWSGQYTVAGNSYTAFLCIDLRSLLYVFDTQSTNQKVIRNVVTSTTSTRLGIPLDDTTLHMSNVHLLFASKGELVLGLCMSLDTHDWMIKYCSIFFMAYQVWKNWHSCSGNFVMIFVASFYEANGVIYRIVVCKAETRP